MRIRVWLLFLLLAPAAGCALDSAPVSNRPASQPPVPEATYRLTFGLKDASPTAWDGRLVPSPGQRIQALPDLLREHNIATGEDPLFPNDYVRTGSSWVASSRKAWMRDPKAFQLEYPSVLVQVWENPNQGPIRIETVRGAFSFVPRELPPFSAAEFLDGGVLVEAVPSPLAVDFRYAGQQDHPAIWASGSGELWLVWQEYENDSDAVCVRNLSGDSWGPTQVLAAESDVFQTAVGEDDSGRIWVVWSMQVDGNWDLYGRSHERGRWSGLERLTEGAGPDTHHSLVRGVAGRLWLIWRSVPGDRAQIMARSLEKGRWSPPRQVSTGDSAAGNNWWPVASAGPGGALAVVWDGYASGSYDVYLRVWSSGRWLPVRTVAGTARFEANPSVAVGPEGRIWVAWQESGVEWGKDTGRLSRVQGTQLRESREIRIVCLDGEKQLATEGSLSTIFIGDLWEMPHLETGPSGEPWLLVRKLYLRQPDIREVRGKLGPVYYPRWDIHLTQYRGGQWSAPIRLARTSGRNAMIPSGSRAPDGAFWLTWATDHRNAKSYMQQHNQVFLARLQPPELEQDVSLVPAPSPAEDPPVPPIHPDEEEELDRIRAFRVEHRGKTYSIYRGDLHRHTEISSDGAADGTLLDAYRYAVDAGGLDFLGVSDHTHHVHEPYTWWRSQKTADLFQLENFVAFYGYERSLSFPSGHRNIFFTERGKPIHPILAPEERGQEGAERLFWYLRRHGGTSIPHTTGRSNDWRDNDPEVETLVEIYQGLRDTYEHAGAPQPGTLKPRDASERPGYVWNALAKGYRLGFIASSDHHSTHMSYACLLAEELTLESLMEAVRSRRAYAATDNIILDVRFVHADGEHLMGEEFDVSGPLRLKARVVGTDSLHRVDVIRNEAVVYQVSPEKEQEISFEYVDADTGEGEHYYYVRVLQQDGMVAWGSPVWVTYQPSQQ